MNLELERKDNKSKDPERKKIDNTEDEKRDERLKAISKKKEERMVEVKRDLEEKRKRRLIVKNSDLQKEEKERERELRNQKKSFSERQMTEVHFVSYLLSNLHHSATYFFFN